MKNVCSTFEHYVLNHNVLLLYIITWMDSESRGISIVRLLFFFFFFYSIVKIIHMMLQE